MYPRVHALALAFALLISPEAQAQSPPVGTAEGISRPNPDPTRLTQEAQDRALKELRELLEVKITAITTELEQTKGYLDATDRRLILRLDNIPAEVAAQVAASLRLTEQRFAGVDQQFRERDERVNQIAVLNNVALQAALSTAEKAVAKEGANTTKQLDQLYLNMNTVTKAQENQINDLKAQLATIDGRSHGIGDSWVVIFGVCTAVVGIGGLLLSMNRGQHSTPQYQYPPPQYPYPPPPPPPPPYAYPPQPQQPQVAVVPVVPVPVPSA